MGLGNNGGDGYGTERITDSEIGFKYSGFLGTVPFRFNIDGFYTWQQNNQRVANTLDASGAVGGITVNVPSAHVKGIEADTNFNPASWLEVGGAANYTNGKFIDNDVSVLGRPPIPYTTYPFAPHFSGNIYAQLSVPVGGDLKLIVRGEEYGQSGFYFSGTGAQNPNNRLPGYALSNFRVGIQSSKGWSIMGSIHNAFNRVYYVGGADGTPLLQIAGALPGAPRTFSLDARLKF